jgi:hypothetical protein
MPSKYMIITALGFTAVLIFGAGFKLGQSHEMLKAYDRAESEQHGGRGQRHAGMQIKTNRIAAIMVMPRSYLPLLEKFKHSKIARRVEVLPAHIDQQDGRLIAISQQPVLSKTSYSEAPAKNRSLQTRPKSKQKTPRITKIAQGAAMLFVLKYAAKSNPRYAAHQSTALKADLSP